MQFPQILFKWAYAEVLFHRKNTASIKAAFCEKRNQLLLLENRLTLRAISEFGGYLLYFYICDRTNLLGESAKNYSRDLFLFLYFLLIIVAAMTSFKVHQDKSAFTGKSILYLNRHQTEEWKGCMQLCCFFTFRDSLELFESEQKKGSINQMERLAKISEYLNIVKIKCQIVDENVLNVLEFLGTFGICFGF